MPKKTKAIPDNRAEWTFGEALYWHFFIFGTRPESSPTDRTGTVWDPKRAAEAVGVSVRGFWNWVDDRHQPYDTSNIERALFGENRQFDEARNELRRLLREARAGTPKAAAVSGKFPAVLTGQAVTVYNTPFEAAEVDGPISEADFRAVAPFRPEKFGNSRNNSPQGGALGHEAPIPGQAVGAGGQHLGPSTPRSRKTVAVICAGVLLVLGGYGAKRAVDYKNIDTASTVPKKDPPPETKVTKAPDPDLAPPPELTPKQPTEQERQAAAEKKRQDDQRAAAQKKTLDELEGARLTKQQGAKDLNEKLKVMALGDDDLCKQKLAGLNVPDFTLKCDTMLGVAGGLKGGVAQSQTASSLNDCASRCRRVSDCVAFTFDAGAHAGSASCYLTSVVREERPATNWIGGLHEKRR